MIQTLGILLNMESEYMAAVVTLLLPIHLLQKMFKAHLFQNRSDSRENIFRKHSTLTVHDLHVYAVFSESNQWPSL